MKKVAALILLACCIWGCSGGSGGENPEQPKANEEMKGAPTDSQSGVPPLPVPEGGE